MEKERVLEQYFAEGKAIYEALLEAKQKEQKEIDDARALLNQKIKELRRAQIARGISEEAWNTIDAQIDALMEERFNLFNRRK